MRALHTERGTHKKKKWGKIHTQLTETLREWREGMKRKEVRRVQ
jgi:hypothetical protein